MHGYGNWDRDLPITDVLSRNRQLPVHWLAAACFARHAAAHASIGENDFRRAVFAFFLPEGAAQRLAARTATRRAANVAPAARPMPEANRYQGDVGDSTDAHGAIQAMESVVMDSIEHAEPPAMIDEHEASQVSAARGRQ